VLRAAIDAVGLGGRLHLGRYAPAEAQAAAAADDIAYNSHDLDDGLRAGLLRLEALADVPLAGAFVREALQRGFDKERVIYEVHRRIITVMIDDVVRESRIRLARMHPQSLVGVRTAGNPVIAMSEERAAEIVGLKSYLFANVYRHPRVMKIVAGAEAVVHDLFARYTSEPKQLPPAWRAAVHEAGSERARASIVADFVAGMTDRYAIGEHRRLFDATPELR
jgi:dGTPase